MRLVKRQLSGSDTAFWKYIFPAFWALFFPLIIASLMDWLATPPHKPPPPFAFNLTMAIGWSGLFICILRLVRPLRKVWRDDTALYVATRQGDMVVPFSEVIGVQEFGDMPIGGRKPLVIALRTPSPIGSCIHFLPQGSQSLGFPWERQLHPVLLELQALVENNALIPVPAADPISQPSQQTGIL